MNKLVACFVAGVLFQLLTAFASWSDSIPLKFGIAPTIRLDGTTDYVLSSRNSYFSPLSLSHNWILRFPSSALVESNWFSKQKTVIYAVEPNGSHERQVFEDTNTIITFQLDYRARSKFVLSERDDPRNPKILLQFNHSVVSDFRKRTEESLDQHICRQLESVFPGIVWQVEHLTQPAEKPGDALTKAEACGDQENPHQFVLRSSKGFLLGGGGCYSGKRPCSVSIFTGRTEFVRILFHKTEFPYLQKHADELGSFIREATIQGNRCYVRPERDSDFLVVAKDAVCSPYIFKKAD
jgi:hypothetical protein